MAIFQNIELKPAYTKPPGLPSSQRSDRRSERQARPRNAHNLVPFSAACQSQITLILEARSGPYMWPHRDGQGAAMIQISIPWPGPLRPTPARFSKPPMDRRLAGAAGFEPAHAGTKNRCLNHLATPHRRLEFRGRPRRRTTRGRPRALSDSSPSRQAAAI